MTLYLEGIKVVQTEEQQWPPKPHKGHARGTRHQTMPT